jgi:predicted Zn finger-like uncharacterized protein
MRLGEGIRRLGFRKWYERRLLHSHAHLVLTLLCAVGVLGAFEVYSRASPWTEQFLDALALVISAGVGIWALRRYLYLLMHAEATANQAACPACKAYARFSLEHEALDGSTVQVACKACGHRWTIHQ